MAGTEGSTDKYKRGDRVFAKLKGYPWWPAQVDSRLPVKDEKYLLLFYGTRDTGEVKTPMMIAYDEQSVAKYGRPPKPSISFKNAMDEAELNIDLIVVENPEDPEHVADTSEGELQIDEAPPVLEREGKLPVPKPAPKEAAPKPPARRLSKSNKRDSLNTTGVPSPTVETPTQAAPVAQPEIVSRSGRKIKPKRFADDEMGSPVTALHKAALQSSFDESSASPTAAKRTKKKSVATPVAVPSPLSEAPKTETAKATVTPKGKGKGKQETKPTLEAVASAGPSAKCRSKPPTLTEAAADSPNLSPQLGDSDATPSLSRADEEEAREEFMEDDTRDDASADKENSGGNWVNTAAGQDSASDDSSSPKGGIKQFKEVPVSSDESSLSGESIKISLAIKKDTSVELVYNHDKPEELPTQQARIEWDVATAKNVLRIRETLESTEPAAAELFNLLAAAIEQKERDILDADEKAARERRNIKLAKLRMEGEVIEIIGDIIGSLSMKAADCDRAIELLDRLSNHELNPLILKKNPEIVEIVRKLQMYEGNGENWNLSPEELRDCDEKTHMIRDKSQQIYDNFKLIFGLPLNSLDFQKVYEDELEKFKDICKTLSPKAFLNLSDDPTEDVDDIYAEREPEISDNLSDSNLNEPEIREDEGLDEGSIDSVEMTE